MTIHLYAELLSNIRTLSIQASLSTQTNTETKAEISTDGKTLTLTHDGESVSITLPGCMMSGQNTATLTIPAAPTKELSFRVRIQEDADIGDLLGDRSGDCSNMVPWSAVTLGQSAEIICKTCATVLLPRNRIQTWKDLPSENWAEMMDFWHCHKPSEPPGHNHSVQNKGYAANSRLALDPSVGFIDPTNFLLAGADCENLIVSSKFLSPM